MYRLEFELKIITHLKYALKIEKPRAKTAMLITAMRIPRPCILDIRAILFR